MLFTHRRPPEQIDSPLFLQWARNIARDVLFLSKARAQPVAQLVDSDAENGTIYFSLTSNALVYKNDSGTITTFTLT